MEIFIIALCILVAWRVVRGQIQAAAKEWQEASEEERIEIRRREAEEQVW